MQSGPRKNPYLTQYKNNANSQSQKYNTNTTTTQKLVQTEQHDNEFLPTPKQYQYYNTDRLIPSIDDETIEQTTTHERNYKSRFSYFEDEAEASLQFFKENLLPNPSDNLKPTGSLLERTMPISSRIPQADSSKANNKYSNLAKEKSLFAKQTNERINNNNKYQLGSGNPVPFKQNVLNESATKNERYLMKPNNNRVLALSCKTTEDLDKSACQDERPVPSQRSRSNQNVTNRDSSFSRTEAASQANKTNHQVKANTAPKQIDEPEPTRATTASPSTSGTFSRRPLYNSLLRAHDSIRLKVNRPKVRPKSEGPPVEDTEIDDSIPLAELNSHSSLNNERAVDVKRSSSRKSKKEKKKIAKDTSEETKIQARNFAEIRIIKIERNEMERSLGITVKAEDSNIIVARVMAGSLVDKQGALQVGDIILAVNGRDVYTPEQLQEELRKSLMDDNVYLKIVPSFREELPALCIYMRALFSYDANEDSLLPCKEVGVSFNQGDILEVVNQEDPNWWQARRVDSENLQTGLIPSQDLEERRRAFVIPDYDLATRTSICGTKIYKKSKKKEIYNVGQNNDFDKAELQLYEEVCRTPAFERRTLILIGANGVGKQALKARLVAMDPDRFGTPLPRTSRLLRDGEEDGVHYHFVTREQMEEDIIAGKYLEFGEYDGALYGTKLDSVREIIGSGKICVLDCSPTCLKVLKTCDYLPFVAFIAAPTVDQLRYMHEWARGGNRNYTTLDRAFSRQSRRAKTLQDFAFDFFEDEDLQLTVEESARLFRSYENYFDIVLVNNNFERTYEQLKEAIDALSMAPQWIPISWIYGT